MDKRLLEITNLIRRGLTKTAIKELKNVIGDSTKVQEYEITLAGIEDEHCLGKIDDVLYRKLKTNLIIGLTNFISDIKQEDINFKNTLIMEVNINNNVIQQLNVAELMAMGEAFAATVLQGKKKYSDEDLNLIKIAVLEKDENERKVLVAAIDQFNEIEKPVIKTQAKNKIINFLATYGVQVVTLIGKVALSAIATKYGVELLDLGID